jgi:hypothetical protein
MNPWWTSRHGKAGSVAIGGPFQGGFTLWRIGVQATTLCYSAWFGRLSSEPKRDHKQRSKDQEQHATHDRRHDKIPENIQNHDVTIFLPRRKTATTAPSALNSQHDQNGYGFE